jgi:hypothetical protein
MFHALPVTPPPNLKPWYSVASSSSVKTAPHYGDFNSYNQILCYEMPLGAVSNYSKVLSDKEVTTG